MNKPETEYYLGRNDRNGYKSLSTTVAGHLMKGVASSESVIIGFQMVMEHR